MAKKRIIGILILLLVIAGMVAIYMAYGRKMVAFVSDYERFSAWVKDIGIWGRFVIIGMVTFQLIVAVIPAGPFELAAGYAYGAIEGTILYVVGATVASVIILILVRKFGTKFVYLFVSKEKIESVKFLQDTERLERALFIFFVIPGTPKDVITYAAGLTKVRLLPWTLINLFGRFPAAVLTILCGDALREKNYFLAGVYIAVTCILGAIGAFWYYKYRKKKKANEKASNESSDN